MSRILPLLLSLLLLPVSPAFSQTPPARLEQAMSDTLDLWRQGRFEQLFDLLAHRGRTSREAFVHRMTGTSVRPACCFQKMERFRVLSERGDEATVYVSVGLEGGSPATESCTREFRLTREGGNWKMQLNDIYALAGARMKKR